MMTPDGRCKTLDATADGYVRGEGVITSLLHGVRSAEEAASAGWQGLVRGTAVNQGGRSSTLTAPNGPSQQEVIRNALRAAATASAQVAALQMHGTGAGQRRAWAALRTDACWLDFALPARLSPGQQARLAGLLPDWSAAVRWGADAPAGAFPSSCAGTPLGDPIEVGAAGAVLVEGALKQGARAGALPRPPLALMASKSWVGHGEPVAGLAGLAHAALALGAAGVLGNTHLREVNPYVINSMRVAGGQVVVGTRAAPAHPAPTCHCCSRLENAELALAPCTGVARPQWVLPRETSGLPAPAQAGELVSGVSAFAFQGTNAHAVLQRPSAALELGGLSTTRAAGSGWEGQVQWVAPLPHCMLHRARNGGGRSRAMLGLECQLAATPRLNYFWDHRVSGKALFPGAGFLELALAAAKLAAGRGAAAAALSGASIPAPLQLPDQLGEQPGGRPVVLRCALQLTSGELSVASSTAGFKQPHLSSSVALVHCAGSGASLQGTAGRAAWHALSRAGQSQAEQQAPASFAGVANHSRDETAYCHPASLDSCLQLAAANTAGQLKVPAGLQALHLPDRLAAPHLAAASQQLRRTRPDQPSVVDYWLADPAGGFGAGLSQLMMKPLGRAPAAVAGKEAAAAAAADLLYETSWWAEGPASAAQRAPAGDGSPAPVRLGSSSSSVTSVARATAALQQLQLEQLGGVQLLTAAALPVAAPPCGAAAQAHGALAALLRTVALEYPQQRFAAVDADALAPDCRACTAAQLQLWQPGGAAPEADAHGLAQRGGVAQRAVLQVCKVRPGQPPFHLMPQPRGAISSLAPVPVPTDVVAPGQVLMAVKAVGINFRSGERARCGYAAESLRVLCPNAFPALSSRDLLNVLGMYPGDPGPPGADSAGTVLAVGAGVQGLRPGDAVFGLAAGSLGTHVRTPAATLVPVPANLALEDAATTPTVFITGALGVLLLPRVAGCPRWPPCADRSTPPDAVDTAFRSATAVRPGERVLVHAAAGGVGLAAIQLVHAMGATAVITAGSADKRALVRSLGVRHALGSRDAAFAAELAQLGGADVALNSLTSAGMVAGSLAALRRGGRFVEISKRDIWSAARVAQGEAACLAWAVHPPGRSGLTLQAPVCRAPRCGLLAGGGGLFGWPGHQLFAEEAQCAPGVWRAVPPATGAPGPHLAGSKRAGCLSSAARLTAGCSAPLQVTHGLSAVHAALRQMSQARHVGKIVVRTPAVAPAASAPAGRVVVTGGLGSLGSLTASWLAQHSKLHVQATGRSGRLTGGSALGDLLAAGFAGQLTLTSADAAAAEDAAALLLEGSGQVAGLVHASGVLADATLRNQTLAGIRAAYAPKAAALRQLGSGLSVQPGAFELLFSSIASLLGSPGQANYAAVNGLLDGMAVAAQSQVCQPHSSVLSATGASRLRRAVPTMRWHSPLSVQGVCSTSMQWGAWAGAGMAGADAQTRLRVERTGLGMIEVPAGLAALEGFLLRGLAAPPLAAAVPICWERFVEKQFGGAAPPMFAPFASAVAPSAAAGGLSAASKGGAAAAAAAAAGAMSLAEREAVMLAQVHDAVRAVLGSADVGADQPLMAAGLDSLSSVELRNGLEGRVGLELPSTLVFDYPTISALAGFLASKVQPAAAGAAEQAASLQAGYASSVAEEWEPGDGLPQGRQRPAAPSAVALSGMVVRSAGDAFAGIAPVDAVGLVPASRWDIDAHEGVGRLPLRAACLVLHKGTQGGGADVPQALSLNCTTSVAPASLAQTCLAACQSSLAPSCWRWTSSMPLPLPPAMPRRPSWTRSSACSWRRWGSCCWETPPWRRRPAGRPWACLWGCPPQTMPRWWGGTCPASLPTPQQAARSAWPAGGCPTPLACAARP